MGQVGLRVDVLVLGPPEEPGQGLEVTGRIAERPVLLERQLEQLGPEEQDLLGPAQDAEGRRQAQLERVLAKQPVAEGVERCDPHRRVPVGDQHVDALLHLERRLVCEREREDLLRARSARGDEVRDATREDGRLAGPGARDDEERALVVGDRLDLREIQAVEDLVGGGIQRRGAGGSAGRVRAGHGRS